MKDFQCPYDDLECPYVDTAGMFQTKECHECEHYHCGVRPTGATPIIAWFIDKYCEIFGKKKEYKPTDDDKFMMGL
jgi:hypothetical protein